MEKNKATRLVVSLIILIVIIAFWIISRNKSNLYSIAGETMGSTYNIKYVAKEQAVGKQELDSILNDFNTSLSTYTDESEISYFNRGDSFQFKFSYFPRALELSKKIYGQTEGAFNPTIGPVINRWNAAKKGASIPTKKEIDSLLYFVDFESIIFDNYTASKNKSGVFLNFNAVAPGIAADVLGEYLKAKGIDDFMVEVGGEVLCHGNNQNGQAWRIGIEHPLVSKPEDKVLIAIATLRNRALATSGNYRSYFERDGVKYGHTIDPRTGLTANQDILSASVFGPDCGTADALATAIMVLGLEASKKILVGLKDIDVYLVYLDNSGETKTFASFGIADSIEELK